MANGDILQEEIARRTARGFEIVSRTENEVQMRKPKRFSIGWALLWFLFFGIGLLAYLVYHWLKSEQLAYLRVVDGELTVSERRGVMGSYINWAGSLESPVARVLAYGWPVGALVIIIVIIAVASSGGGDDDSGAAVQDPSTPEPAITATATPEATEEPISTPEAIPTPTPEPTEAPEQDDLNLALGETAKVGDAEVTAHSFRLDSGSEFFAPDAGNVWIVIDATIVNTGDDEYNFSSFLQLALRDTEGREYDETFGPDIISQLDGTILAGDNLRGEVAFEVPEAVMPGLKFVFKQVFGSGQARWNLE